MPGLVSCSFWPVAGPCVGSLLDSYNSKEKSALCSVNCHLTLALSRCQFILSSLVQRIFLAYMCQLDWVDVFVAMVMMFVSPALVDVYRWPMRYEQWWECKFLSEGIIDQGGGFRDSLSDLAEELCPSNTEDPLPLPFFIRTPNHVSLHAILMFCQSLMFSKNVCYFLACNNVLVENFCTVRINALFLNTSTITLKLIHTNWVDWKQDVVLILMFLCNTIKSFIVYNCLNMCLVFICAQFNSDIIWLGRHQVLMLLC